jgi:hypothetical protein
MPFCLFSFQNSFLFSEQITVNRDPESCDQFSKPLPTFFALFSIICYLFSDLPLPFPEQKAQPLKPAIRPKAPFCLLSVLCSLLSPSVHCYLYSVFVHCLSLGALSLSTRLKSHRLELKPTWLVPDPDQHPVVRSTEGETPSPCSLVVVPPETFTGVPVRA